MPSNVDETGTDLTSPSSTQQGTNMPASIVSECLRAREHCR